MSLGRGLRVALLAACLAGTGACATLPPDPVAGVPAEVEETIALLVRHHPDARRFLDEAYAYAVFPRVGRFAFGFGGASGNGYLVEQSQVAGRVRVAEFLHGISFGGEIYGEIIFFRDPEVTRAFKEGHAEFRGRAGLAVGPAGRSADSAFPGGVAVFRVTRGGAMLDASVAAAWFRFAPLDGENGIAPAGSAPGARSE